MSDPVVDEIFWEFGRRLLGYRAEGPARSYPSRDISFRVPSARFIVGWTGNVQLENRWPEDPQIGDRAVWYSSCEWLLAKLEVAASAGCIPEVPEERVLAIVGTLTEDPRRPSGFASWRLGLAKDYVGRMATKGIEMEPASERLASIMGEYMALVDEFRTSQAGRAFLGWANRSTAAEEQRARLLAQRLKKHDDMRSSQVLEGASEFIMLVANCYARLQQMDDHVALRSACWCFHGNLFRQQRAFELACAIQSLEPNLLEFVDAQNEEDPSTVYDRAGLLEHWQEFVSQQEQLRVRWSDLTSPERWASNRTKSSWREVLGQVGVVRY